MDPNVVSRLMSKYTQKLAPSHWSRKFICSETSQTYIPHTSWKQENKIENYTHIQPANESIKALHPKRKIKHPIIRKLNKREFEIRTKILSTIISEGDLKSVI